jgi:hypothetical protein
VFLPFESAPVVTQCQVNDVRLVRLVEVLHRSLVV